MQEYFVVWQLDGPVTHSIISAENIEDFTSLDWVVRAALTEGYLFSELTNIEKEGYSLFMVIDPPQQFYEQI